MKILRIILTLLLIPAYAIADEDAVQTKEEKTEVKEEKSNDNSEKVEDSSGGLNASDIASLLALAFGAGMSADEGDGGSSEQTGPFTPPPDPTPVSYTHLTLPTILLV